MEIVLFGLCLYSYQNKYITHPTPLTWVVLTKIGGLSDKPSVWTVSFVEQLLAKQVSLLVIMGKYKLKIGGLLSNGLNKQNKVIKNCFFCEVNDFFLNKRKYNELKSSVQFDFSSLSVGAIMSILSQT